MRRLAPTTVVATVLLLLALFSTSVSAAPSFTVPLIVRQGKIFGRHLLESMITVGIGTPAQPVQLFLDTGSYYPTIFNASCPVAECGNFSTTYSFTGDNTRYDSAQSSSAVVSNSSTILHYGAGTLSGFDTHDIVKITNGAGIDDGETIKLRQTFALIDQAQWNHGQDLASFKEGGIFGVSIPIAGYPSDSRQLSANGIHSIATWLPRGRRIISDLGLGGVVQLGGYDILIAPPRASGNESTRAPAPEVTWKSLPPGSNSWQIPIDDLKVNNVSTSASCSGGSCLAFFDTGGAVMQFQGFNLSHQPKSEFPKTSFSCRQVPLLPTLTVVISGTDFTLEPQDYVIELKNGTCESTIFAGKLPLGRRGRGTSSSRLRNRQRAPADMVQQELEFQATRRSLATNDVAMLISGSYDFIDLGIMWSSRVVTIFDWKEMRLGFVQHD